MNIDFFWKCYEKYTFEALSFVKIRCLNIKRLFHLILGSKICSVDHTFVWFGAALIKSLQRRHFLRLTIFWCYIEWTIVIFYYLADHTPVYTLSERYFIKKNSKFDFFLIKLIFFSAHIFIWIFRRNWSSAECMVFGH